MKPEELISAVESLSRESFSEEEWLQWFNEALNDLASVLRLETYETFALAAAGEKALPGDIYEIRRFTITDSGGTETELVRVDVGNTSNSNAYWLWNEAAYFPEAKTGTGKLWYYRYPGKLTLGSGDVDVPDRYEDAVILYAAAKSKAPDRWLEDKNDLYRDYLVRKEQIKQDRNKQFSRPRRMRLPSLTFDGRRIG